MNIEDIKIELISFKLCPFVNRSVITLLEKGVEFDITFVDIFNKPDWFAKISPMGKVPVLRVNNDILFESAVINEFLDEITPGSLHPSDPLIKAKNRAWIEYGSTIIMSQYHMFSAKDEKEFVEKKSNLISEIKVLDEQLTGSDYFNGKKFNLIDAAYAPILRRMQTFEKLTGMNPVADFPKIQLWRDKLLVRDSVKNSVVNDFDDIFFDFFADTYMGENLFMSAAVSQSA